MAIPILQPATYWECPSCGLQDVTHNPKPHTRMHSCDLFAGFSMPMVKVDNNHGLDRSKVRHRMIERGDWVGQEVGVATHEGRAIMAVHTERPDGSHDTVVYAPTAVSRTER